MKSIVLTEILGMKMRVTPDPCIVKADDVLLQVRTVGVCGSDIHYYKTGRIGSQVVKYPYAVGHEFSGTVLDVGSAVTRVKPGDHVAVDPAMPCRACDECRMGRLHTCRNLKFLGCPGQADGCLSEMIVMPEGSCFKVGPEMSLEDAAIVEPLSIGVYAVKLSSLPMRTAKIGILGFGPIGMSVLLSAMAEGAKSIYVTDKIDARLDIARSSGAAWAGNRDRQDVLAEITEREPALLDVVFECCGQQEALNDAIHLLKPGGKLMFVGIPEVDRVSFACDKIRRKEICIQNVRRQNECVQAAIDLIQQGQVDVSQMITHRYALEDTKDAFDLVCDYADGVMKAVVNVST
ncbi:MAG: alcohol dehydrogenase catalytic domain-containing protein [Verrucomicrobia bacterium]|nr:alcohol dehydrogenase catalytic domain-containing protein [Verrucomicrobiota bacterium]